MKKLPISAVVVSKNEAYILERCLKALQFCQEVILIDLKSTDNCLAIGKKYATKTFVRASAPYVEKQQHWISTKTCFDWILYIDPDEILDKSLAEQLSKIFKNGIEKNICQIFLPWQFYFKKKKLIGTTWGGNNSKGILIHKNRIIIQDKSQKKFKYIEGFTTKNIKRIDSNVIHHYWMINYKTLLEKHNRYIRIEAKDEFEKGLRYSFKTQIFKAYWALKHSLITKQGYKDGMTGIFLSLFYMWYIFMKWNAIRKYENKIMQDEIIR